MPCGTNSSAQRSVSKISAAFAAPYCPDIASWGDQPEIDATLITEAPVRPFICGSASRIIRTVWIRFRSMAPRQSSSVLSEMRAPPPPPPTLLIRISIPPKATTAAWTSPAASSGLLTSAAQAATFTVLARNDACASANCLAERAESINRQPSAANALAVARPIPRLEPVIRATLPVSLRSIALSFPASPQFTRLAVGDPGLHTVVIVGEIVLGNVIGCRGPDAVMSEDVAERLVEVLGGVWPADIMRVQRQTHDPSVLGTLAIERVELVLDHLLEVIRLAVPGEHAGVVGLAGIGYEDEFLPAADIDRPRLVVDDP